MQDAVGADPGLQVGEALAARGGEDDGDLPYREDRGHRPQSEPGCSQTGFGRGRPEGFRRSPTVLHVRHAASASAPFRSF
ncbi:hypothetical protein Scel_64070 [Streptomyces cellostaticus]|nr:hypothetical protein Scel_64070 [Streptomyces cellostaticus]